MEIQYPIILIDNLDTSHPSKRVNIGIELRNDILKELLSASNESDLPHVTITNLSKTFKCHHNTMKTI